MPSYLTRKVISCLLANETIVHRGCIRRQSYSILSRQCHKKLNHGSRFLREWHALRLGGPRRSLFNLSFGSRRAAVYDDPSFAPGIEMMQSLVKRQRLSAQLIQVGDIERALRAFLKYMRLDNKHRPLPDTQAHLVLNSLRYIMQARNLDVTQEASSSSNEGLAKFRDHVRITARILGRSSDTDSQTHLDLARFLLNVSPVSTVTVSYHDLVHRVYIKKLCSLGRPKEALDLLLKKIEASKWEKVDAMPSTEDKPQSTEAEGIEEADTQESGSWPSTALSDILRAFAKQGEETELLRTANFALENGYTRMEMVYGHLIKFYADRNDISRMKQWYSTWSSHESAKMQSHFRSRQQAVTTRHVLECCLRNDEIETGNSILQQISAKNQPKLVCDEILAWNLAVNKSVDEVGPMLDLMTQEAQRRDKISESTAPDITTINRLIEVAIASNNPYMAERLVTLGRDRGIQPDARTLTLQMGYRISVNDIDGALVTYQHLQMEDMSSNEDIPTTNRLIVALCLSKRHDFETIMNVAADLSDRQVGFEPITVQHLCLLHLRRDEILDVQDLLKTHANGFTSSERASLRAAILQFCVDSKTPIANTWDAYNLLRDSFDEMPRDERLEIIRMYFERNRPDMAAHVFAHMRQHSREDTIPDVESYVTAFLGCAKTQDMETLEVINNQLKLDVTIDLTTRLRNSLMIAFTTCRENGRALAVWDDIVNSREGPTYNSLVIALQICENTAWGDVKAQQIWSKLRKNNVELDHKLWAAYLVALVGNGNAELAVTTLEEAVRREEVEVDELIIASIVRAAFRAGKSAEMSQWAKMAYPQIWTALSAPVQADKMSDPSNRLLAFDLKNALTP